MAERTGDHVALAELGHAAAGQLEGVVGRLVVEDLDHDDDAFLGGNINSEALPPPQAAGQGERAPLFRPPHAHTPEPGSASLDPPSRTPPRRARVPPQITA